MMPNNPDPLRDWIAATRILERAARHCAADEELAGRLQLARELVAVLLDAREQGIELVKRRDRPPWWRVSCRVR
jgi:hypothetical protein